MGRLNDPHTTPVVDSRNWQLSEITCLVFALGHPFSIMLFRACWAHFRDVDYHICERDFNLGRCLHQLGAALGLCSWPSCFQERVDCVHATAGRGKSTHPDDAV